MTGVCRWTADLISGAAPNCIVASTPDSAVSPAQSATARRGWPQPIRSTKTQSANAPHSALACAA